MMSEADTLCLLAYGMKYSHKRLLTLKFMPACRNLLEAKTNLRMIVMFFMIGWKKSIIVTKILFKILPKLATLK